MSKSRDIIQNELRRAGSEPTEAAALGDIAIALLGLKETVPPMVYVPRWSPRLWRLWPLGFGATAGVLLGIGLLAIAQTSAPGTWLYPLKRASEDIAVQVQPSYRETVMMRRADEVKQLVNEHSQPELVSSTLNDYRATTLAYKNVNYAAMEYCQRNLTQAEAEATPSERQQITETLGQLKQEVD